MSAAAPVRRKGRGLAIGLLGIALGGCATGAGGAARGGASASVLAEPEAYVDRIDGAKVNRRPLNEPQPLAPGKHTIALRRRTTAAASYGGRPPDYPLLAGRDETGRAVYLSESTCTVNLVVDAGARYTARTAPGSEPAAWTGSVSGPGGVVDCSGETHIPRGLLGTSRFLCCTMAFKGGKATDANYRYQGWRTEMLPAGTPLRVTEVGRDRVTFEVPGQAGSYKLYLEYGNAEIDTDAYFQSLLPAADPTAGLAPDVAAAVARGELHEGTSRAQTILARGYPPRHKTAELEQMQWYYYDSPGTGVYVTFVGDVLEEIHAGPPP